MIVLLVFRENSYSQIIITTPYPASAQDVTKGFSSSLLTVQVVFANACNNNTVEVRMPIGIQYVPGSVSSISGTLGITENNISNLRTPIFNIANAAIGNTVTFTILRTANCNAASSGKDSVFVVGSCGNTSETSGTINNYSILSPSFSITNPSTVTDAVVGQVLNRTILITNGGNGATDTLRYFVVYPNAGLILNNITFNGISFSSWRTNGDTIFFKIFGNTIFGGNNLFQNGESVSVVENLRINVCEPQTLYGAQWGRNQKEICQTSFGTGTITMATGVPNRSITHSGLIGYTNACNASDYTITITNNGTGNSSAATLYNLIISHALNTSGVGGSLVMAMNDNRFNISNWRIGGNPITVSSSGAFPNISYFVNANQFNTNPDGVGGLEDLDGDGVFDDLAPGSSVVLTIQFEINDYITSCGTSNLYPILYRNTNVSYSTMCSPSTISSPYALVNNSLTYLGLNFNSISMNNFTQSIAQSGTPFRMNFEVSNFSPGLGDNFNAWPTNASRRRWIHKLILPAGYSVSGSGNVSINGAAHLGGYTQNGDTVFITRDANAQPGRVGIDLVYTCGSGGTQNINYLLEFIDDRTASPNCLKNNEIMCFTFSITILGCSPCAAGGPTVYLPSVRRDDNSYGFTDNTFTTRVANTSIAVENQKTALYLDTIRIEGSAKQGSTSFNNNIFYRLALNKTTSAQNKLQPYQAVINIFRAGTLVSGPCILTTANQSGSNASVTEMEWDLSSCIPAGGLQANDSIHVVSKYVVSSFDLPTSSYQLAQGTRYSFYNKDLSNNIIICNEIPIDLYLTRVTLSHSRETHASSIGYSACNQLTLSRFISYATVSGIWPFGQEIRPFTYWDSIRTTLPNHINVVGLSKSCSSPVPGTCNATTYSPVSTINNGNGTTTYVFRNDGTWPINRGSSWIALDLITTPTCLTPSPNALLTGQFSEIYTGREFYYAQVSEPFGTFDPVLKIRNLSFSSTGFTVPYPSSLRPNLSTTNLSGTIQATKTTESLNIRINNPSSVTTPNVWLAIPNSATKTIVQVLDLNTMTALTPIAYSGGVWYQISNVGLTSGQSRNYRIDFNYTACVLDSFLVLTGWDCAGFPSVPASGNCLQQTWLRFQPMLSEVQLSVTQNPPNPTDLCTQETFVYEFNSSQSAYLKNPYIDIFVPTGFTINLPIRVEYPNGSGNIQNATSTAISGGYRVDLTSHTSIGTEGIPGTLDNSSSSARTPRVFVDFEIGCSFVSGRSVDARAFGNRPCGSSALGNSVLARTNSINVTGAASPGPISVSMISSVSTLNCSNTSDIINSIIPITNPTQVGDTIVYVLPSIIRANGGFTNVNNCVGCSYSTQNLPSGETLVKIALGVGIAPLTNIEFSFQIKAKKAECGNVNIESYAKRDISGLSCGITPCTNSSIVTGNGTPIPIGVEKPELSISNFNFYGTRLNNYHINATVTNSSSTIDAQSGITIKTFVDLNSNNQYDKDIDDVIFNHSFSNPIAMGGGSVNLIDTFYSNYDPTDVYNVFSVIDTGDAVSNCFCGGIAMTPFIALPMEFLNASVVNINNQEAKLEWSVFSENKIDHFKVYRKLEGENEFKEIGSLPGNHSFDKINNYEFVDDIQDIPNGRIIYYIVSSADKKSQMLSVFKSGTMLSQPFSLMPNPVNDFFSIINNESNESKVNIQITDMNGKLIYSQMASEKTTTINTLNFAPGIYNVNLFKNDKIYTYKISVLR